MHSRAATSSGPDNPLTTSSQRHLRRIHSGVELNALVCEEAGRFPALAEDALLVVAERTASVRLSRIHHIPLDGTHSLAFCCLYCTNMQLHGHESAGLSWLLVWGALKAPCFPCSRYGLFCMQEGGTSPPPFPLCDVIRATHCPLAESHGSVLEIRSTGRLSAVASACGAAAC